MAKRVVIADDADFHRTVLKDILTRGGFEVVGEAVNGEEALSSARALRPDIVILDIVMPLMNGIEAAREIRLIEPPVKIIMCTSLGYEPIVEEALKSGACAYIVKPLSEKKVLAVLAALKD